MRVLFQSMTSLRLEDLMRESYTIRILRWLPIIESLKPKVYITTFSVLEEPLIEYLNTIGIKTVFWAYACNPFFFTSQNMNLRFRSLQISNIMSRTMICWNSHFAEFVNANPQNGLETRAIGPLMCGDETIMVSDKEAICNMLNIVHDPCAKYIGVFDAPENSSSKYRNSAKGSQHNTSEYNYLFMRDLYRLHTEFPNTILIYKPKRSLTSGKFSYSSDLKKLFADMIKNPRVAVLDYNINPWVPLALADIAVCPPFESPTIAALHYGKLGLFYDPTNLARYHLYHEFPEILTYTYYDLKFKVDQWVNEKSDLNNLMDEARLRRLQGDSAKSNSSRIFREYLSSLATNP
ncbi:MAG: polysaccharide biosynthesis PFTS motif protein [Candidatus Omnitrophica bacterium]|nr:polysaccharide biosynthesis PFTS motif protein [Candidatus Omnitrophota bacterium]